MTPSQFIEVRLSKHILFFSGLLILLSLVAKVVNHSIYQYPGNQYFPPNISFAGLFICLMLLGFWITSGVDGRFTELLKEVIYFFLTMCTLTMATNSAQFTPFEPIDLQIVAFERHLGINESAIVAWSSNHYHFLRHWLEFAYHTLATQMSIFALLAIGMHYWFLNTTNHKSSTFRWFFLPHFKKITIRKYYFYLIVTGLIGYTFYYFFPTVAPATTLGSAYFKPSQYATGLKFYQIHHHIPPTTMQGGLIALPSFHVIWSCLTLFLMQDWPVVFVILLPINVLLVSSCILLGWHYATDILGSMIVLFSASQILSHCMGSRIRQRMRKPNGISSSSYPL